MAGSRTLSEAASKELLAAYGVPFAREEGAADAAGAVRAAEAIGFPASNKHPDVVVHHLFEMKVEPALQKSDRPVFVYDYPAALCPLTKRQRGNPAVAERFELYVLGMELANAYTELNDPITQEQTFRQQLADGTDLDDLLVPAFATVREAAKRTLGQRHFDVQLIGGMVLHEGRIAEMKTGEGKTLVATLPVYLNALTARGVHVVTVNDYLAKRDAEWMGRVYKFLGLTVGCIVHELDDDQRRAQ